MRRLVVENAFQLDFFHRGKGLLYLRLCPFPVIVANESV